MKEQNIRGIAYTRYQRNRAINRKFGIRERLLGHDEALAMYPERRKGQLSKGKIHCSCSMCREKSYIELTHKEKGKLYYDLKAIDDYLNSNL